MSDLKATSVRVFLWVESDAEVDGTVEAIADTLVALGYQTDEGVLAAIVVVPNGSDVKAWSKSPKAFGRKVVRFASSVCFPGDSGESNA